MGGNSGTARKFPGIGVYRIRTGVYTGNLSDFPSKPPMPDPADVL